MKYLFCSVVMLLCCAFMFGQPYQGPFGLKMGLTFNQLKAIDSSLTSTEEDDIYLIREVPTPNSHFEEYYLIVTPSAGLCKIIALTEDTDTNGYGIELRQTYTNIRDSLKKKYGDYSEFDYLLPGSMWDEPDDFMMGIMQKDRYLMSTWSEEHGSSLVNQISTIGLDIFANSSTSGVIRLIYEFENFSDYIDSKEAENDESF